MPKLPYNPRLKPVARKLRKAGILSEVLLWNQIKNKQILNLDFNRQKIIGNYIVDFYCKELNLIIEINGISHENKEDYDKRRTKYLESLGLKIITFFDIDIKQNLQGCIDYLTDYSKSNIKNEKRTNR